LPLGVTHDEAGIVAFLNGPRRREAAEDMLNIEARYYAASL
jgi:hypothetical protein